MHPPCLFMQGLEHLYRCICVGDSGFFFDSDDDGRLKWTATDPSKDVGWGGWVLAENPPDKYNGNPQLFWVTAGQEIQLKDKLERIDIVAEYLQPGPGQQSHTCHVV